MKKILLDTNAISRYFSGDQRVHNEIITTDKVFISIFVIAELFVGFKGGKREKQNREILDSFLSKNSITLLEATKETAEIFSEIKAKLIKKGKPIPLNDVWIAAHVIESGSKLITYDKHFNYISGLRIWDF